MGHGAPVVRGLFYTAEEMIANLEETAECEGRWLRASVGQDGTFTVMNNRNGFSRSYAAR